MLYVDLKYISLIGPHLRNFRQKNRSLFNCSCPICGDSERKQNKARGFFYQHGNSMRYKCHNCAAGMGIGNFLKSTFPTHYDSYVFEKYKSGVDRPQKQDEQLANKTRVNLHAFQSKYVTKISELPDAHYAKQYVVNRQIPNVAQSRIYFTEDFAALVNDLFPNRYANLKPNEPRLIIPFLNENRQLIGLQGRSFAADKQLRYITIRADNETDLVYGLDRVDYKEPIIIVEGPIDSLFLHNCVAAANSDLASVVRKLPINCKTVLVYDNEPRNKEIVQLIDAAIKAGHSVCIWPHDIHQKDINDIILSGKSPKNVQEIINERVFSGLQAELEFLMWKKT
jgi:hypothetical protein